MEAQSRTAARACGKPLAAWIMVIQTAVFRHDLHSALSTSVKGCQVQDVCLSRILVRAGWAVPQLARLPGHCVEDKRTQASRMRYPKPKLPRELSGAGDDKLVLGDSQCLPAKLSTKLSNHPPCVSVARAETRERSPTVGP